MLWKVALAIGAGMAAAMAILPALLIVTIFRFSRS